MSGKPVTPMVGCDTFVLNDKNELLLIQRSDTGLWATPGGCQDLGETPVQCAERECWEESGYRVKVTRLLGVYSSQCYEYVDYPWKENEFTHLVFQAELVGHEPIESDEVLAVKWFPLNALPEFSDGHEVRVRTTIEYLNTSPAERECYFE